MKEVLKKYTFLVLLAFENFLSPNVLKVYFFHASSVLHFARNFENFQSLKFVKSSKSMLKVYFSEVLKKYTSQKHERSTKKVYFLVLLASENFLSPNVLKVYFFHASSVLHFARNFENFQSLKFVKSSKSMLKVYFSEVLKKYTSQKHERSTKKVYFLVLLASENFLSPNVLKVYFFHASSVLHFKRNFENFQSLKFVKSSKSMLKVYFSEVLKKYTSQKHERSTKKVYFSEAWKKY